MTSPLLHGLPPIIDDRARVLILGNMPSVLSLATQQYYGNPRNAFWRIMGEIFCFDAEAPYAPRGCVAQAWTVAEVLRCWRRTEPVGPFRCFPMMISAIPFSSVSLL